MIRENKLNVQFIEIQSRPEIFSQTFSVSWIANRTGTVYSNKESVHVDFFKSWIGPQMRTDSRLLNQLFDAKCGGKSSPELIGTVKFKGCPSMLTEVEFCANVKLQIMP